MLFDTCKICLKSKGLTNRDRCLSCAHLGQTAWNTGLKGYLGGEKHYNFGKKWSEETKQKMGQNRKGLTTNEKHPGWKDDAVGYVALHDWVKRNLGKAQWCTHCMSVIDIQWANISHQYRRDIYDWMELCRKCHSKWDKNKPKASLIFLKTKYGYGRRIAKFA